ncbi:flagellar hook-basal body complex protein FliE [Cupriavidus sp. BIS7]|jgi:flagellar hook-basal body complex protein FliE|uniref:flagellar hook-basal body complex protein FliE n=1 Tax=Cupriavidus sp. BIS7 TaxID=1217718 RepID=UPI0002E03274|nr:flagellar hook-basal body complex protein FliE [Cupriavidus sp. BIS7]
MTISSIEGMLQQLRGLAQVAGGGTTTQAATAATESFSGELQRSLQRLNATQDRAYGKAEAFELGKPGVSLNDVMIDMQKANISFQTAVQVRNRLTTAYQEMMNMTV